MSVHLRSLCPSTVLRMLPTATGSEWTTFNPSIARSPTGDYACLLRTSNYQLDCVGRYSTTDPNGAIRTKNYLCDLSQDLWVTSVVLIDDSEVVGDVQYPMVNGLEDGRLFWDCGWRMSGTLRSHREDGVCSIAVDSLVKNDVTGIWCATWREVLTDGERHEKNWMPMPVGDRMRFVYNVPTNEVWEESAGISTPLTGIVEPIPELWEARGGSQLIPAWGGLLGIVHFVYWLGGQRQYFHRFVYFDNNGVAISCSDLFHFMKPGIEFAAGIVEWNGNYVVSFGSEDRYAMLCIIDADEVEALLRPPSAQ